MNTQLINFYLGNSPDSEGRYLSDILDWNDEQLEESHDYIQWLFPLEEPSQFNPDAPLLDNITRAAFLNSEELRGNMVLAFNRMLKFYNLTQTHELTNGKSCHVVPTRESTPWVTKGNHNYLRLTRMLRSLNLCGLGIYSDLLFEKLDTMYMVHRESIGAKAFAFWQEAAEIEDPEEPPPPAPDPYTTVNFSALTISSATTSATYQASYNWAASVAQAKGWTKP